MKIAEIISYINNGGYSLPEFQRGYVWNRDQVRELMRSLYSGYPVGSLLIWRTPIDPSIIRGDVAKAEGYIELILDGQQRVTSLYGIITGK